MSCSTCQKLDSNLCQIVRLGNLMLGIESFQDAYLYRRTPLTTLIDSRWDTHIQKVLEVAEKLQKKRIALYGAIPDNYSMATAMEQMLTHFLRLAESVKDELCGADCGCLAKDRLQFTQWVRDEYGVYPSEESQVQAHKELAELEAAKHSEPVCSDPAYDLEESECAVRVEEEEWETPTAVEIPAWQREPITLPYASWKRLHDEGYDPDRLPAMTAWGAVAVAQC